MANHALVQDPVDTRPRSPIRWIRQRFMNRINSSPPQIDVEPPSRSPSNPSETATNDPIFLSPDHANRPLLPQNLKFIEPASSSSIPSITSSGLVIPDVLTDDKLPLGFVPIGGPPIIRPAPISPEKVKGQADDYFSASHPDPTRITRFKTRRPSYEEAPIPPGIQYPDVPIRPSTATGFSNSSSSKSTSRRARKRGMSTGVLPQNMSPNALQRPFSIFSDS
jgi:hypothetical protein